ncbi:LCP family protein [Kitasatospora sp. LaBMicrA B282]|uniref:LCP family protein n=1 Tax=Kitasatospora sp. LaBMicrA B282 TaxID=3420949 RepID=UPI003D0CB845
MAEHRPADDPSDPDPNPDPDRAPQAAGAAQPPAGGPRRRLGRRTKRLLIALGVVLALCVGAGAYLYISLDGNIRSSALFGGSGSQAPEARDTAGRTAENILVIGSDTRDNATDCSIGGDCGPGANADVEMVVHLSADRSNATVLSIPRDIVMELPGCKDPQTGQLQPSPGKALITNSLQWGPGCTVAAVNQLTGITIDHFLMVDFAGVVSMSDAIGGVPVCVDANLYDPDSHLKLTAGTHTLQGVAALEFLRTRHGFGDGSDLGREQAQHLYLSALVQKLKSAGTLAHPATLYSLADAATKALTVDPGLDGLTNLIGLADRLNSVPTRGITFLTTPTLPYNGPDPGFAENLTLAPQAQDVFEQIRADRSFAPAPTPVAPAHSAAAHSAAAHPPSAAAQPPSAGAEPAPSTGATSAGPSFGSPNDTSPLNAASTPGCAHVSTEDTTPFGSPIRAFDLNPSVPNSAP